MIMKGFTCHISVTKAKFVSDLPVEWERDSAHIKQKLERSECKLFKSLLSVCGRGNRCMPMNNERVWRSRAPEFELNAKSHSRSFEASNLRKLIKSIKQLRLKETWCLTKVTFSISRQCNHSFDHHQKKFFVRGRRTREALFLANETTSMRVDRHTITNYMFPFPPLLRSTV